MATGASRRGVRVLSLGGFQLLYSYGHFCADNVVRWRWCERPFRAYDFGISHEKHRAEGPTKTMRHLRHNWGDRKSVV